MHNYRTVLHVLHNTVVKDNLIGRVKYSTATKHKKTTSSKVVFKLNYKDNH